MSFEATHEQGSFWKKVTDCLKDLVTEANFEVTPNGVSLQSVDSSHVALVSLNLGSSGFTNYQCNQQRILGINLANFAKLLKVADDKDSLVLRHEQDTDILELESSDKNGRKTTTFSMKLMEIEADAMGVPDDELDYRTFVSMPADLFAKLCKDMATFGENMSFKVSNEELTFSAHGDLGEGSIKVRSSGAVNRAPQTKASFASNVKPEKTEGGVKAEVKSEVKKEPENQEGQAEEAPTPKSKKEKGAAAASSEETNEGVYITCGEEMDLTFALRYLGIFSKGVALSNRVNLALSTNSPCRIEFDLGNMGHLRWFLAPKVDDENTQ